MWRSLFGPAPNTPCYPGSEPGKSGGPLPYALDNDVKPTSHLATVHTGDRVSVTVFERGTESGDGQQRKGVIVGFAHKYNSYMDSDLVQYLMGTDTTKNYFDVRSNVIPNLKKSGDQVPTCKTGPPCYSILFKHKIDDKNYVSPCWNINDVITDDGFFCPIAEYDKNNNAPFQCDNCIVGPRTYKNTFRSKLGQQISLKPPEDADDNYKKAYKEGIEAMFGQNGPFYGRESEAIVLPEDVYLVKLDPVDSTSDVEVAVLWGDRLGGLTKDVGASRRIPTPEEYWKFLDENNISPGYTTSEIQVVDKPEQCTFLKRNATEQQKEAWILCNQQRRDIYGQLRLSTKYLDIKEGFIRCKLGKKWLSRTEYEIMPQTVDQENKDLTESIYRRTHAAISCMPRPKNPSDRLTKSMQKLVSLKSTSTCEEDENKFDSCVQEAQNACESNINALLDSSFSDAAKELQAAGVDMKECLQFAADLKATEGISSGGTDLGLAIRGAIKANKGCAQAVALYAQTQQTISQSACVSNNTSVCSSQSADINQSIDFGNCAYNTNGPTFTQYGLFNKIAINLTELNQLDTQSQATISTNLSNAIVGNVEASGKASAEHTKKDNGNPLKDIVDNSNLNRQLVGKDTFPFMDTDPNSVSIGKSLATFCDQSYLNTMNNIALKTTSYISVRQHVSACINSITQIGITNTIEIRSLVTSYVTSGVSVGIATTISSMNKQDITTTLDALTKDSDIKGSGTSAAIAVLVLIIIVVALIIFGPIVAKIIKGATSKNVPTVVGRVPVAEVVGAVKSASMS